MPEALPYHYGAGRNPDIAEAVRRAEEAARPRQPEPEEPQAPQIDPEKSYLSWPGRE